MEVAYTLPISMLKAERSEFTLYLKIKYLVLSVAGRGHELTFISINFFKYIFYRYIMYVYEYHSWIFIIGMIIKIIDYMITKLVKLSIYHHL